MFVIPTKSSWKYSEYITVLLAVIILAVVILSILCSAVIPLAVNYLLKSPYDYPGTKWVAEEIDLWFIFPENEVAYGELTIEDTVYKVNIDRTGRSLSFYIYSSNESGEKTNIFRCQGRFNGDGQFRLKISDDYFNLGYTSITLVRID